ncbi:MAG: polysaccharide pyruvyl transferase family protein [Myxococcales bacterium]|nr:polysaccharide pyruvyl transferase family protein [Myxococcales bacterium]
MRRDPHHRRVLCLNGYGNNLGDQAIFAGFLKVFLAATEAAELEVTLDQSFIYGFPFRPETIATVNEHYDLVVLAGGGFIYHRPHDGSASGWGFDIPEELIPTLRVPYAIYSTGYNYRAFAEERFPPQTASHLRATVRHAAHFSVREHGSMRILREEYGVTDPIDFVPDAALHVQPIHAHLPQLDPDRPSIGLCLRLDRADERFPPPFAESFEHYVRTLVESMRRQVVEEGCQVVFTPHLLTKTDVEVGALLKQSLPAGSVVLLHEAIPSLYGPASLELPGVLAGVYRRLDTVLGQRLHSLILPFAVGTPVVSITSTESSAWMQEEFGMPSWMHLDISRPERDVTVERITSALWRARYEREELSLHALERRAVLAMQARRATAKMVETTLALPETILPPLQAVAP